MIQKKMDCIKLINCKYDASIGVYPKEKLNFQEINIDVEMYFDIKKAAQSEKLKDTVDYHQVSKDIESIVNKKHYPLIETLIEMIASTILYKYNLFSIRVRLRKPKALKVEKVDYPELEIYRFNEKMII